MTYHYNRNLPYPRTHSIVLLNNGSVVVECRFAERSTADGCYVIFKVSSKGTVKSTNITKSDHLIAMFISQYIV